MKANSQKRFKVVITAFACSPYQGSEDGVGWNLVSRLGRHHDVTVIYGDIGKDNRRQRDIQKWIHEYGNPPGVELVYVSQSSFGNCLLQVAHYGKRIFPPLVFVFYYAYRHWLRRAYRMAESLHTVNRFDCAHQLTYVSYREPGYLWKLSIPFFWGPITGTVNAPWAYFGILGAWARLRFSFRNLANMIQRKGTRYILEAAREAKVIWVVANEDKRIIHDYWQLNTRFLPATGTDCTNIANTRKSHCMTDKLKIVWSGILEGGKALPLLLHALSILEEKNRVTLDILGSGPEKQKWLRLSEQLKIDQLIRWRGHMKLADAKSCMADADIFVFTSIKEGTPTVIMEALQLGLPVVCHDACGMALVIDDSCGIKIPMLNPETSIQGFHDAIKKLVNNPQLLIDLSQGAIERASEFTWEKNAEKIASAYTEQSH
jgi:glycosyltransferase involved in cell wall biosynthesis